MWETWLLVAIGLLALAAAALAAYLLRRRARWRGFIGQRRPARDHFRREPESAPAKRVTIIVNPTKVEGVAGLRDELIRLVTSFGWAEPTIVETTVEDPGRGQARAALADGADLVCVLGGDGTVRAIAEVLAGTRTPMGLLPGGTGNLLARNLQLPLERLDHAIEVALTGFNRHIDIGWVTVDPTPEQLEAAAEVAGPTEPTSAGRAVTGPGDRSPMEHGPEDPDGADLDEADAARAESEPPPDRVGGRPVAENEHAFLVMAGLGLDAAIMEDTSEHLKAAVGWPAYFTAGVKNMLTARFRTSLVVDGGAETRHRARTIVVGNCGVLTGGITLMPDAEVDDGILDVVALTPKGPAGWVTVAAHVLTQRKKDHSRLERYRCRRAVVTVEEPQRVQMDGDVLGEASQVLFTISPRALIVRVATIPPRGPAV